MKLKDYLKIVYNSERLSIFDNDHEYLLHNVKKDEIIRGHSELLDQKIWYVGVHWYTTNVYGNESDDATLGIVLM